MGRRLIFIALVVAMSSAGFGQNVEPPTLRARGPRPITKTEGRTILAVISTVDTDSDSETDCSHLVHDVYEQAGFPYDYASSRDLYIGGGSTNFTRVRTPQAGDLVVWRGHVGIVSDPKEHSFFSFTRTGPDTQFYDSTYWRSRGSARFYRYMTDRPLHSGQTLEATRRENRETLAANHSSENRPPAKLPKPARVTSSLPAGDPSSSEVVEIPQEIVLQVSGKSPAPDEIAAAFAEMNLDSVKSLRMRGLDGVGRPLIVYGEIRVSAVESKGKHGAALLSIESVGGAPNKQTESAPRWREVSLVFEKTKRGWVISPSQEAAYVSREAALQVLSARLSELTRNTNPTVEQEREQKKIIHFVNLLVPEDSREASAQNN